MVDHISWLQVSSGSRRARPIPPPEANNTDTSLRPSPQSLGTFRSGSLPNVAAPQAPNAEPESDKVPTLGNHYY